jgi:hypothetical protein
MGPWAVWTGTENQHQQIWGDKVEEKIYLAVRKRKRLNVTGIKKYVCTYWGPYEVEPCSL